MSVCSSKPATREEFTPWEAWLLRFPSKTTQLPTRMPWTRCVLINSEKSWLATMELRLNINVSLQYMEAWLRGLGCVPIHNMMEDAATAEISRSQVWQWAKHNVKTAEGVLVNADYVSRVLAEETVAIKANLPAALVKGNKFDAAKKLLESTLLGQGYAEFLTVRPFFFS